MSSLKNKAKTFKASLGFFIGLVLMLLIFLMMPIVAGAILLSVIGAIAAFLGSQYVAYKDSKKRKED